MRREGREPLPDHAGPLGGTRRVGGLLGVAGRLSGTVSPFRAVCVCVCVCVCVLAVLCSLWDLRSLTRDQTCALSSRGMESQPWTPRDVPGALSFDKDRGREEKGKLGIEEGKKERRERVTQRIL